MNDREIRKLQMFIEVNSFGTTNAALFKSLPLAGELFAEVSSVVTELSEHARAQESGNSSARKGASVKAVLREELRQDLLAISRTARVIAISNDGFEDKFRTPQNGSDRQLISVASSFASDAVPFISEFVKYGLPETFLEELNKDIELFENAIREKVTGKGIRVTATASIDDSIEKGMRAVRKLNVIVKNMFSSDPVRLAGWESAMVTGREPRPKVIEEDAQPTPTQQ
jgi:hypothetical protein